VIAPPETNGHAPPARLFRVPLGQVVRLDRCGTCHGRLNHHRPSCQRLKPRLCRGCGRAGVLVGAVLYCEPCRAQQCPGCRKFAGRHTPSCLYLRRRRRGAPRIPGVVHGVVTREDLIRCFVEMRAPAVRLARTIVGDGWAEDIAQETFLYLVDRRDELKRVPTLGYVLKATRHGAYAFRRALVRKMAVSYDPAELADLAELMYALEHGRTRTDEVRLPRCTRACPGCGADLDDPTSPRFCGACAK
jgi:hypothetical protein